MIGILLCLELSTKYGHIPVEPDATDIVDQTDFGILYLNITGLVPELQNDGSHLGSAGCSDGMTF